MWGPSLFCAVILSTYSLAFAISVTKKGIRAPALDDYTCSAIEKVFETSPESLMVCLATCVSEATCSSVVYKPNWCRGCPNQHLTNSGLTHTSDGTVFYNVAEPAIFGEDCTLSPCLEPYQICKFNNNNYICLCIPGCSLWTTGGPTNCAKDYALVGEDCSVRSCNGNDIGCVAGLCECDSGTDIKYYPELGQCFKGKKDHGTACSPNNLCREDNNVCIDGKCACDHGYSHDEGNELCTAECGMYGNTYQEYPTWKLLFHWIHTINTDDINVCKTWCSNNDTCRSFSVWYLTVARLIPLTCYFHDVTALDVLPFWEYHIDLLFTFSHFVRNCQ